MRFERNSIFFTDPTGSFEHQGFDMENTLRSMVLGARRKIVLMTYSLPSWDRSWFLFDALTEAVGKGVSIEIYAFLQSEVSQVVSWHRASGLIRGWYWNQQNKDLFHLKGIVVDDMDAYIGSANLSKNGIRDSAEWGIKTTSPDLCGELKRYIVHLISENKLIEVMR